MSVFCRHNRFTADCPICSKGTALDPEASRRAARRPSRSGGGAKRRPGGDPAPVFSGPHVAAGPYEDGEGSYVVRLERVPGGVRLAEWAGSRLRRRAPVLPAGDVAGLAVGATGVLPDRDAEALAGALRDEREADAQGGPGVSGGRSGEFKEELRVEDAGDGRIRVARWILRPGSGWELQDAPPMLPASRFAEALSSAVRQGLLSGSPSPDD